VDGKTRYRPPDYQHYSPWLKDKETTPPTGLIRYLYTTSPGTALLTLKEQYSPGPSEGRDILWAEHAISDALWKEKHGFLKNADWNEALKQLIELSRHKRWWVRLYVAEILRQHPQFDLPRVIRELKQDENALVREAATAAEKAEKPKPPITDREP
jgi:hypothetical protein